MSAPIRRAARGDAAEIAACLNTLGYDTPELLVAERLATLEESISDLIVVAGRGPGSPVHGVASAHALPLIHVPGLLVRLTALAVRPEAQRGGVGRALVAAVESWAWEIGARRIEVTSGDHRLGAHAFYRALGYAEDERRFIKHVVQRQAD